MSRFRGKNFKRERTPKQNIPKSPKPFRYATDQKIHFNCRFGTNSLLQDTNSKPRIIEMCTTHI